MKNFGDNIEEFFRDALGDYEASYNPGDWNEMNEKLDQAEQAGNTGGSTGWFKSPVVKLGLGALIIAGGAYLIISNSNEKTTVTEKVDTDKVSIFERITSAQNIDFEVKPPTANQNTKQESGVKEVIEEQPANKNYYKVDDVQPINKTDLATSQNYIAKKYDGPYLEMLRNSYIGEEKKLPPPSAEFTADIVEGCTPLTVQFTAEYKDIGLSYLWDFGDGTISPDENPMHVYPVDGNYDVQLTVTSSVDEQSETNLKKGFVSVYSSPVVSINGIETEEDEALVGNEVGFVESSKDVVEWQWFFGDQESSSMQNPSHSYAQPGQYSVVLVGKNSYGCLDTAVSTIFIMGKDMTIRIFPPNVFTPNGDGLNDIWIPHITNGNEIHKYDMTVYDRLGNLVFETDDVNEGWDGTYKDGKTVSTSRVFIWVITIEDEYGNKQRKVGNTTLRR